MQNPQLGLLQKTTYGRIYLMFQNSAEFNILQRFFLGYFLFGDDAYAKMCWLAKLRGENDLEIGILNVFTSSEKIHFLSWAQK